MQEQGCWTSYYTNLYGDELTPYQTYYGLILTNGVNVSFSVAGSYVYDFIAVDTNGFNGPNVNGKDIHTILVYPNTDKVIPAGAQSTTSETYVKEKCPSNLKPGASSNSGNTCGYRILRGDYAEDY